MRLYFRTTRKFDGRRVENKIPIGFVRDFPDKAARGLKSHAGGFARGCDICRRGTALRGTRVGGSFGIHTPESAYHNTRLQTSPPKSLATKVGLENCARYTTTGNRAMADDLEKESKDLKIQRSTECVVSCRWFIDMANDMA
jgi:hypothetical protein